MEYDIGASEAVSTAVVRAVSALEDRKPQSLRPLVEILDPDALDSLFEARGKGTARPGGRLSFVYSNCQVTIDNGEYLTLQLINPQMRDDRGSKVTDGCVR
jgi:hypothetical protein